jgi:hypothetical protein
MALAASALFGIAGIAAAQSNPAAHNPALSAPNAGVGPSSSIGPSSAQGGPAIPGTNLGTTGVPNNANAAPPPATEGATRCDLLSGLEKDRCLRDAAPASAPIDTGSAGPGSTGMGSGR